MNNNKNKFIFLLKFVVHTICSHTKLTLCNINTIHYNTVYTICSNSIAIKLIQYNYVY